MSFFSSFLFCVYRPIHQSISLTQTADVLCSVFGIQNSGTECWGGNNLTASMSGGAWAAHDLSQYTTTETWATALWAVTAEPYSSLGCFYSDIYAGLTKLTMTSPTNFTSAVADCGAQAVAGGYG